MSPPRHSLWLCLAAVVGLAASISDGPPPLPPTPHKSAQVERVAGAALLAAKPAVVRPPRVYALSWTNIYPIAVDPGYYAPYWNTAVLRTTNFHDWQTFTNVPLTVTVLPVPPGWCYRVAYHPI